MLHALSHRSLGVVLFELCTLEHAFRADVSKTREKLNIETVSSLQNVMAVMYRIVQGESPQLGERFNPALRLLCSRLYSTAY